MKSNQELKEMALEALNGRWNIAIKGFLVYLFYLILISYILKDSVARYFIDIIFTGPIILGVYIFSLKLARKERVEIKNIFDGFENFLNAMLLYILKFIYILLWMLLLIIPGIIKSISYSQAFFIMAEDKLISPEKAINKSMLMMDGYKMKYFMLSLSFIGWILLSIISFGIGFIWLFPYMHVTYANFYIELKKNYNNKCC